MGDHDVVLVAQVGDRLVDHLTSEWPAAWIFLRSTEAPIAEEPMPASQAKTIERTWPVRPRSRTSEAIDFLPFIASMEAVAPARSPSSARSSLSRKLATRKQTAAEKMTEQVTPTRLEAGAWSQTAMIEPGAAGARRPESKSRLVATPVMPPRITARISFGFMST